MGVSSSTASAPTINPSADVVVRSFATTGSSDGSVDIFITALSSSEASPARVSAGSSGGGASLQSRQVYLSPVDSAAANAHSLCTCLKRKQYSHEKCLKDVNSTDYNPLTVVVVMLQGSGTDLWHRLQLCKVTDGEAALLHTAHLELRCCWQSSHTA